MTEDTMLVTTVRLPPALLKKIQSMARDKGVKTSAILRSMIAEGAARSDALKAAESDAGTFLEKLMELTESMEAIRDREDEDMETAQAPETTGEADGA